MEVNRSNPIPLYIQIAERLRYKIQNEVMKPGEKVGTQTELEALFGVSKITIRQAIQLLVEEGLLISKQGKGTFVKPVKVEQELLRLQSLSEIIEESGYEPTVELVTFELTSTPKDIKGSFGPKCFYVKRLHIVERKPIAFAHIYLPYDIGRKLEIEDISKQTIYDLLENKLGIKLGEAIQKIESCASTKEHAGYLNIAEGTPLLKAERLTYDMEKNVVEKITFYYKHDEFSFKINLSTASQSTMWPS